MPIVDCRSRLPRFPTASALLAVWERPWSQNAVRYCAHALTLAHDRGCDVLEAHRTRYSNADAITEYHARPHSQRAHARANAALDVVARLMGEEREDLDR